jgi:putative transposase
MSRGKHTEAQMIAAVKQMEAGRKAEEVAREVGVSTHTIYAWKSKYGGMDVSEAQEAKRLRDENGRLRKLVADLSLDKEALQSVIEKTAGARRDENRRRAHPPEVCLHCAPRLPAVAGSGIEFSLSAVRAQRGAA